MMGTPQIETPSPLPGRVVVVGVCAAGKSTLVARLRQAGYDARSCAQEHSYVPDMWRRLARPQALVYLDASLATVNRRLGTAFEEVYLARQRERLAHARAHCDVYVATDALDPAGVCAQVVAALAALGVPRDAASSGQRF